MEQIYQYNSLFRHNYTKLDGIELRIYIMLRDGLHKLEYLLDISNGRVNWNIISEVTLEDLNSRNYISKSVDNNGRVWYNI